MDFFADLTWLDIAGHLAVFAMCGVTLVSITACDLPVGFMFMLLLGGPMMIVVFESLLDLSLGSAMIAAMVVFAILEALWLAGYRLDERNDNLPQATAGHEDWKP